MKTLDLVVNDRRRAATGPRAAMVLGALLVLATAACGTAGFGEHATPAPGAAVVDEDLMETVQRATFRYFWDLAHPVSGLARERIRKVDLADTLVPFDASYFTPSPGARKARGLRAEYFANRDLAGAPALVRVDRQVAMDWKRRGPGRGLPADGFSVRWTGTFVPKDSGVLRIGVGSDDGARLILDGETLIDHWSDHAYQVRTESVALEAGRAYAIRLEYYENAGEAAVTLGYSPDAPSPDTGAIDLLDQYGLRDDQSACAIGGTGMGVMAIIVAAERGWVSRESAVERILKISEFLARAERFHGIFPHWMDGATGRALPFTEKDNGGDVVESAYLFQGLLAAREYFSGEGAEETRLRETITRLWEEAEWDWYTGGQKFLYWHWSPDHEFAMNHRVGGWNECLIAYVLAASSPTHAIDTEVYHEGWAYHGRIRNTQGAVRGITIPLGDPVGGPLFFAHYSFLGLDPRGLRDRYADYWEQNRNHTLANRAYCLENPGNYPGYGEGGWGLTASDNPDGYAAHSPGNDRGVLTPTAALSSFPYTPAYSMQALAHFYHDLGDTLWTPVGFVDAYAPARNWTASTHLAIDQGPIIIMMENHRTGLLWRLFMKVPDVQRGLERLEFTRSS